MSLASHSRYSLLASLLCAVLGGGAEGCASVDDSEDPASADSDLSTANLTATWIYSGPLPAFESPEIFVSMKAHTARVTGLLPANFDESKVPFYAHTAPERGRTRITVVYPIASGKPGKPHPNNDYNSVFIDPHHTTEGHFGGFPFIGYTGLIGFHGPITEDGPQWVLNRGQVSGGCNRMQGEHVVELAFVLGMDMSEPQASTAALDRPKWPHFALPVHVHPTQDVVGDTAFDVDYPVTKGANVELPKVGGAIKQIVKFPTWSADDFPESVCAFKKGDATPLPKDYCRRTTGLQNKNDLFAPFKAVTKATVERPFTGAVKH